MNIDLAVIRSIIIALWLVAGAVWLIGAVLAKRSIRRQSPGSRLLHMVIAFLAFLIGFSRRLDFGLLSKPFVPAGPEFGIVGLVLTAVGIAFAIWARLFLGGNWSGTVTLKQNHTLVTSGPYRLVRHPIYTGLLLALLGTAIDFREVRALFATGLILIMLLMKIRIEENFMREQFGEEYREYSQQVKALIPLVY